MDQLSAYAKLAAIEEELQRRLGSASSWKPKPLSYFYGKNPYHVTLNPALAEYWMTKIHPKSGMPVRNRSLYGGRSSSKSHDAAGILVYLAQSRKLKIMATRQFQNSIADSFYALIQQKIEAFKLTEIFSFTNTSILCKTTGTEFIFKGINRNITEIKSTEGIDILLLEECQALTQEQHDVLAPTIRKDGSEIWLVFNPDLYTDFVVKQFIRNPDPDTLCRHINYTENPFMSPTMQRVVDNAKLKAPEDFEHIYLGVPKRDNDKSVIQMKYLLAAVGANEKLGIVTSGQARIGYDVADDGDDVNATVRTLGNECKEVKIWKGLEDQLLKSVSTVYQEAKIHDAFIVFDCIGVGAGVGSKISELNDEHRSSYGFSEIEYIAFNAGSTVMEPDGVYMELPHRDITNREHFENRKAQAWMNVADRLRHTFECVEHGKTPEPDMIISIDPEMEDIEILFEELTLPYKDVSNSGKFMVEPKKKLRERGIPSPNRADAFIMAFCEVERDDSGFFSW